MNFTELDKRIGENLKNIRRMKRISQEKVGELLGVSYQQIQKYEKGKDRIRCSYLFAVSQLLKVSINDFFNINEKLNEETKIITNFRAEKDKVINVLTKSLKQLCKEGQQSAERKE
jgi:transcriptional regulator with XRE-family HTH domain